MCAQVECGDYEPQVRCRLGLGIVRKALYLSWSTAQGFVGVLHVLAAIAEAEANVGAGGEVNLMRVEVEPQPRYCQQRLLPEFNTGATDCGQILVRQASQHLLQDIAWQVVQPAGTQSLALCLSCRMALSTAVCFFLWAS